MSRVAFPVEKGEEFVVAVDGHGASNGHLALNWNVGPPNDDFAFRHVLSGGRGSVTGTTEDSTWEELDGGPIEARDDPANVWFLWRAPASGDVRFEVSASSYRPGSGCGLARTMRRCHPVATVGQVLDKSVWIKFPAEAGRVYRIEVVSDGFGPFALSWEPTTIRRRPGRLRPRTTSFADAQAIAGESGLVAGTNRARHARGGRAGARPRRMDRPSVWYRWTAPFTGTAALDTTGSDFSTVLAVYGGDRVERARRIRQRASARSRCASA